MKIKFGILGTATIATEAVIPAMLESNYCEVYGIASRTIDKAKSTAIKFQIPRHYGSYQELLDDTMIDAVYIPLPNHLHVVWSVNALHARKHVLVEKPVALSSTEARMLYNVSNKYPNLKIGEAFMYKLHPQRIKVKDMILKGEIGTVKVIQASFSFFLDDTNHIIYNKELGGGSLMDIGCYPISVSRFLFESEPVNVISNIEYHTETEVDIVASGILEFEKGYCNFFSAIQLSDNQQVQILGSKGIIELDMPFNPLTDEPAKIILNKEDVKKEITFEICNQYTLQADAFALAIIEDNKVSTDIEDAVRNMEVIERVLEG